MIIGNLVPERRHREGRAAGGAGQLPIGRECECESALKYALVTAPDLMPEKVKRELVPHVAGT